MLLIFSLFLSKGKYTSVSSVKLWILNLKNYNRVIEKLILHLVSIL
ncbi:hypothetical protein LEP1GSC107_2242 [Leptospira interrogans serovar Grippotyphosa str. UI 12769]|uniref:Uncharacterized protein n=1 Tax=Leptospira interrogans serovar Hardjo str. Norma TaxID=1279460 RepID=A0A0M4NHW8_LEPIR|nr:hypothetical protein G436_1101 [Leptospira interrogans serovar Hardjo str. Norma]EKO86607.1 hypothetical protein LEP1GSC009_0833 [Leptospira interrogans serovar Grippotyphosa str. Andaman]EKR47577.1 hypothetical protein LEP1GSC097_3591 [Leptospira interrogans serovar Grippotyphosa str. UI 08368]EMJ69240.1 hypothetical protein LEP1GSC033_2603 [Leptospira interrogans str. 2002000632]EMJ77851.1 hypothetical protein LEP1GSC032_4769 [Leptospira interrogans str. 2002000631]EMN87187.1 hypothetical